MNSGGGEATYGAGLTQVYLHQCAGLGSLAPVDATCFQDPKRPDDTLRKHSPSGGDVNAAARGAGQEEAETVQSRQLRNSALIREHPDLRAELQ